MITPESRWGARLAVGFLIAGLVITALAITTKGALVGFVAIFFWLPWFFILAGLFEFYSPNILASDFVSGGLVVISVGINSVLIYLVTAFKTIDSRVRQSKGESPADGLSRIVFDQGLVRRSLLSIVGGGLIFTVLFCISQITKFRFLVAWPLVIWREEFPPIYPDLEVSLLAIVVILIFEVVLYSIFTYAILRRRGI